MCFHFVIWVKIATPFLGSSNDRIRITTTQLNPGAMTNSIGGMLQVFQQSCDRLASDFDWFLKGTIFYGKAENPSMNVITIRVSDIVLHVTDDCIMPVGNIQRSVFSDDRIRWTEIAVIAVQQFDARCTPDLAQFPVFTASRVTPLDFDVNSRNKVVAIKELDLSVIESLFETFAIEYAEFRNLNRSWKVALHPRIFLA